jgi:hypothetical protein
MAKSRKHMHKKRKGRRVKRTKRFMKGGDFTEQQKNILVNSGFNEYQIDRFTDMDLTFDQVNQKMQEIEGEDFHVNSDDFADAVELALFNEYMNQGMPNNNHMDQGMPHDMDMDDDHMDDAGPMDIHELDVNNNAEEGSTDNEAESDDDMHGGRRRKRTMKKRKGRKTMKTRKGRKTMKMRKGRKTRSQRGGVCYGNGVGANNYDPSFSIYNTRELTLFPYKPTN